VCVCRRVCVCVGVCVCVYACVSQRACRKHVVTIRKTLQTERRRNAKESLSRGREADPQHATLEHNSAGCRLLPPKNALIALFSDEVCAMCSKNPWELSGGTKNEVAIQPQIRYQDFLRVLFGKRYAV